jgi:hypothetical protein
LTDDRDVYFHHPGICINYSDEDNFEKGIRISPHGLLFENGIHLVADTSESYWDDLFCFFPTKKGDIPFDLFAASFYLITRYEEYFPGKRDKHERYCSESSILHRNKCMENPIVDRWAYKLLSLFNKKGYDTSGFRLRKYNAINTYDIDLPFAFRNKGIFINIVGIIRNLLKKDFIQLKSRIKTLLHIEEDPYFGVLFCLDEFQKKMKSPYYLFILLGKYEKYGKKTIYPLRRYYKYLKQLTGATIGIHPSYSASFDRIQTEKEKKILEKKLEKKVTTSRQHFLRMQFPQTFRQLADLGLKEDFSLIYPDHAGFRGGTSIPFNFYDLEKDVRTPLLLRPTIVMDASLISYLKLGPNKALDKIRSLADTCKQVGGDFIMLWHNSNLMGSQQDNPWIDVFNKGFRYAISLENDNFAKQSIDKAAD